MPVTDRPIHSTDIYKQFRCIAADCSMTCCQEWTIGVDDKTLHRWRTTSMDDQPLNSCVEKDFTGHHRIRLNESHRCPWLNADGLCRIVLTHGEEFLSATCHTFPRQHHRFADRLENTVMNSCPEVLDFLRKGVSPWPISPEADNSRNISADTSRYFSADNSCHLSADTILDDDDYLTMEALRKVRYQLCHVLEDRDTPIPVLLQQGDVWLKELWENESDADAVLALLQSPRKSIRSACAVPFSSDEDLAWNTWEECSGLLLDFTENYRKEGHYKKMLDPLCREAERVLAACDHREERTGITSELSSASDVLQDLLETYDAFFRAMLISDCYSSLLSEETTLTSLIQNYQWLLLRWACIRHGLLLHILAENSSGLSDAKSSNSLDGIPSWSQIRDLICTIYRMTSFSESDIRNAIKNMFDETFVSTEYVELILLT